MKIFPETKLIMASIIGTLLITTSLSPVKKMSPLPRKRSAESSAESYNKFLEATYLQLKGKSTEAVPLFDELAEDKSCPTMYEPYLQALFDSEKFSKIVELYNKHQKDILPLFEKNHLLKACVAQSYLATKHEKKAQALFDSLLKDRGDDAQTCYFIVVGYFKTRHVAEATKLLEKCLANDNLRSKHYLFNFLLSKAYLEQNKPTQALACVEKSIAQFPKFDRGWLFKAVLHEQQGRVSEAITGYKKFLDLAGRDQSIEKQLIQLLFSQQRYNEAADYLKKLSVDSPEYCFDLALIQAKEEKYKEALENINKVLALNPDLEKAKLLRIEVLLNSGNTEEALTSLKKWILAEPHNLSVLHTLLLLRQGNVGINKLIDVLQEAHTCYPKALGITAALADLTCEDGDVAQATTLYRDAIAHTSHKKLQAKIYFQICYLLLDQKNYSALEDTFKEIQKAACTDHTLQNLQAYYYAQTDKNLDQSLSLITKALQAKPGNSAYLDTQNLIFTKMGRTPHTAAAQQQSSPQKKSLAKKNHGKEAGHNALQPWWKTKFNSLHSRR